MNHFSGKQNFRAHNMAFGDGINFDQRNTYPNHPGESSASSEGQPREQGREADRPKPSEADAVVVTALESEYRAVAEHLVEPFEEHSSNGTLYRIGTLKGKQRTRRVALAQTGPGNVDAGVHLERARAAFDPEVIVFVGVAGGIKDVRKGDVVVADAVYDYETGKVDQDGFRSRAKTEGPSHPAMQRVMDVVFRQEWPALAKVGVPGHTPRAFVKPIAAGNKVVADRSSATAESLRLHCGDAVAVEMEGYGFLRGAYLSSGTHALVVRGISDLVDGKTAEEDDFWQPVAAGYAAAFTCAFLDLFDPGEGGK
ncbi:5'-methylthioadenosine/S-adenosylhomocysteine nucleosidase family protein [Nocardiopsis valliformis]|uniref:5'-methylthioadenosine/S-adenosylhomocysteine nucleosidase family protein n=1 Tax=Nocardiopsis valliformis TaxID=239974 RepID=UPI00034CBF38|nr:5'-methylthioadenosine/S-adenosylhomocysteine nucleosidase [Nocardiopsis valliformis]